LVAILWPRERFIDRHRERGKFIERDSVESKTAKAETKLKTHNRKPRLSNHISRYHNVYVCRVSVSLLSNRTHS